MKLSRPSRIIAALIAVISMLFMQLAVAGYVCPEPDAADAVPVAEMLGMAHADSQGMPGCESIDMEQPNLCHSHEQIGKQSLDKPQLPPVQQFIPAALASVVYHIADIRRVVVPQDHAVLRRSTAPPLAIRHCCFRI